MVWNIEFTFISSLQIKTRKYSAGKYVWHCFWKGKDRGKTVNKRSAYAGAVVWRGSTKKALQEI